MYSVYAIIAIAFILLNSISFMFGFGDDEKEAHLHRAKEKSVNFKKRYQGIVIKKFSDPQNHNWKTLEIHLSDKSSFYLLPYRNDQSGFYNFVHEGDSIFKEDWGFTFRLKRQKIDTSFVIHPDYID